jgi:hypothetical protein
VAGGLSQMASESLMSLVWLYIAGSFSGRLIGMLPLPQ